MDSQSTMPQTLEERIFVTAWESIANLDAYDLETAAQQAVDVDGSMSLPAVSTADIARVASML